MPLPPVFQKAKIIFISIFQASEQMHFLNTISRKQKPSQLKEEKFSLIAPQTFCCCSDVTLLLYRKYSEQLQSNILLISHIAVTPRAETGVAMYKGSFLMGSR